MPGGHDGLYERRIAQENEQIPIGQLAQARAQLAMANINVKRDTPLAQAYAIAQSQLDNEEQQQAAQGALGFAPLKPTWSRRSILR